LSLPISQVLALFTVILPLLTGISTPVIRRLLHSQTANLPRTRSFLYLILLLAFQLIYETIVTTLSLTYMFPTTTLNCGLNEQWAQLWRNKDETAIRRIQDRFDCCGFNSPVDRAWPFPSGSPDHGINAKECEHRFGRHRSCAQPWRQAEQFNAGLFLTVGVLIIAAKVCNSSDLSQNFLQSSTSFFFPTLSRYFKHISLGIPVIEVFVGYPKPRNSQSQILTHDGVSDSLLR
jgi:hypothetical protein